VDCKKVFRSAKDFCNAKGLVNLCLEIGMVNTPQAWTLEAAGAPDNQGNSSSTNQKKSEKVKESETTTQKKN